MKMSLQSDGDALSQGLRLKQAGSQDIPSPNRPRLEVTKKVLNLANSRCCSFVRSVGPCCCFCLCEVRLLLLPRFEDEKRPIVRGWALRREMEKVGRPLGCPEQNSRSGGSYGKMPERTGRSIPPHPRVNMMTEFTPFATGAASVRGTYAYVPRASQKCVECKI